MLRLLLFAVLFSLSCQMWAQVDEQFGYPNAYMGKAGTAAKATLDSLSLNPAHAGEIDRSEAQARWGFASVSYTYRYPGFAAESTSQKGLNPKFPIPSFIYKPSRRLGFGGIIVPFAVKQNIDVKNIPLVVLSQVNKVDMSGSGQLSGFADLNLGYLVSSDFSIGVNFKYAALKGAGDLIPSGVGTTKKIASFGVASSSMGVGAGFKFSIDDLSLAMSTMVATQKTDETQFSTEIELKSPDNKDSGESQSSHMEVLNPIRVGIAYDFGSTEVMMDMRYTRANKNQKRFSVVDFREKQLDVYDTLAVFFGGNSAMRQGWTAMYGGFYEPSAIGPGSTGENGTAGFGFFDLALTLGEPPSTPAQGVGGGLRYQFERERLRGGHGFYRIVLEGGLVYAETSIGIDESGEQPGAYLARRYLFPFRFGYRF